jgi:CPA1 family monovalent cation:H+ antiporter
MGGGALVGVLSGAVVLLMAGRTDDHLVEIALTTVAAYGSFLVAEHFHASGVFASLAAGLVIGNVGWLGPISNKGRRHLMDAWDYFAFLANSFVFILIGMHEATQPILRLGGVATIVAIVLVLLGRAAAVYPLSALFGRSKLAVPRKYQHVLVWGGLRGALGLALALALPPVPERTPIILTTFLVVAFSLFVQGLTMSRLVRRLGIVCRADDESEHCRP